MEQVTLNPLFFLKVETIGDAYMVVSGVPERSKYHAEHVADLALDMISAMPTLVDPSKSSPHLRIRVGKEILLSCPVYRKYKCNFDSTVLLTTTATATKTALKSEVALLQSLWRLFNPAQFVKCWQFFWS